MKQEASEKPLRPTHVVTNFLMRFDENKPRLLIVRRSQHVGSYHGLWGGISGFIEPGTSADEQALTEINEETGLQHDQVQLLKRGSIVEHREPDLNRHFFVHPFLFKVFTPEAIQTDWEATEMSWIEPEELSNYPTVPQLQEAFNSAFHGEEAIQE